ncbi:hypothetical protein DY000_02015449 [Brassica cretica]|uniref:Uncharacterized protein n=1 Tax=Brassica cretica TaxID=69181 RepID=A0ABQ7D6U5_BRACR|nr:hypothetical protein DY000_02015449 [Brassica cretica]
MSSSSNVLKRCDVETLRPEPQPLANPPETTSTHSEDATEPMEVDKAPMRRTLRKRKEKVVKHLKRGANEKEMKSFQKRVFRIPLEKPFEEVYFTHRLWMFSRETKETEEDIRRIFYEAIDKMKNMITLKKKSDPGKFAEPCMVKVGAVCNKQTNQLCLTLIDPPVHYNPIPFIKPQTSSRRSDDPRLIAACHCRLEYETEYSTSIETHTPTSIDITNPKSIDNHIEESIDSSSDDWENDYYNPTLAEHSARPSTRATPHREKNDEDYEEERATGYKGICTEEDRLLHHSSWTRNATSIDTHHH